MEYGCEVWGGCNKGEEDKLEKVQLEAARLVTGLPLFTSKEYLYLETGWETLAKRRESRKLNLFHKIFHYNAPDYLNEIIEPYRQTNRPIYNLRSNNDFYIPNFRLNRNSFFPSSMYAWNNINLEFRHNPSHGQFKRFIKSENSAFRLPAYLFEGDRKLNVLLTRLRCFSSSL